MLQGLVIRRVFGVIDLLLVGLVLAVVTLVVMNVVRVAPNAVYTPGGEVDVDGTDMPSMLRDVKARAEYSIIEQSRLFGKAGEKLREVVEPPAIAELDPNGPEETQLHLILHGTSAVIGAPENITASATIENKDSRQVDVYGCGDEVLEQVLLLKVYPRKVLISNKGAHEYLSMDDEEELPGGSLASEAPRRQPTKPSKNTPERITLNKSEFIEQLYVDYADLLATVKPEYHYDADGNIDGITASNLEDIPLAKTLNFQDGDVLQSINGEKIDSQDKIIKLIQKYRSSNMFRVNLQRDGKTVSRQYRFDGR